MAQLKGRDPFKTPAPPTAPARTPPPAKSGATVKLTLILDDDVHLEFLMACKRQKRSMSDVLRELVQGYVADR